MLKAHSASDMFAKTNACFN